jgi:hypothetical protein
MRRVNQHPDWCARGAHCTAHRRDGEHRSHPITTTRPTCRLITTRAQTAGGRMRVELRAVIDLPAAPDQTEPAARDAISTLAEAINPTGDQP